VKTIFRNVMPGLLLSMACAMGLASGPASAAAEDTHAKPHQEPAESRRTLIGLQYEAYFTKHNVNWDSNQASGSVGLYNGTAEAIPILGKYSSFDASILKKHEEWFEYLGIDWLLIDWTNFLIAKPAWETQQGPTHEVEQTAELLFNTYRQLQKEGKHPPKFVFMMPPYESASSVPVGIQRLNHLIDWTTQHFLNNPEYKDLWLRLDGKPLLNIAAWSSSIGASSASCADLAKITDQVVAPGWRVRWMGTQLQDSHVNKCGYWSWMDGTIRQAVTFKDGVPEETVVTPACFPFAFTDALLAARKGWLDPKAVGRDHGAPYIESWKVAFANRPRVIQIHQWNEFSGQTQGMGPGIKQDIYGDEYNLELSDDLEPTKLDKCGYRGCGGWGYYYMNLTKALISLYRNETPDITVLALSGPAVPAIVKNDRLPLTWDYLGKRPNTYTIKLDGRTVADNQQGEKYTLELSKYSTGKHTVQLVANGVHTYFDLAPERLATKSDTPLPVTSAIEFKYSPAARRN
jgi:hypothetical protein